MIKTKVAVFVSGRGSNLASLIAQQKNYSYDISLLLVSKSDALAIEIAKEHNIPFVVLNKEDFFERRNILDLLQSHQIQILCLAGFLWKIPSYLIQAFPNSIVNIHPALLPKFGGKGMFGIHVHKAVIAANETISGITIHLVNEQYDEGKILFQTDLKIHEGEHPESLAKRILALEHTFYPKVLDTLCSTKK